LEALGRYALLHTKSEILDRGLRENVTVAPISTIEDLTRFRQLEERGYWLMAPLLDGREAAVPGIIAKMSETPLDVERWAPTLGQHNNEILVDMLGMSKAQVAEARGTTTS
jgi:crotonobetainyl-CoA:carnitine CoA-transferase CaiB-like acyl-CoA transferase